jgi:8-oxo-dGTP pyrophosphatase MutT (NUDIX family)
MGAEFTPVPTLEELRALARVQGVDPTDADLEGVLGFLGTLLPALRELEEETGRDIPPAGMYIPDPEAT